MSNNKIENKSSQLKKIFILVGIFLLLGGNVYAETFGLCETDPGLPNDSSLIGDLVVGTRFNLPTMAEITKIEVGIDFLGSANITGGIFDNAYNLVAETNEYINSGYQPRGYYDLTFTENPILLSGNYWLVVSGSSDNVRSLTKNNTTDGLFEKADEYDDGLPLSFSSATYENEESSAICATYSVVEGGVLSFTAPDIADILANVSAIVADVNVVIMFAIGLPLGFWVVKKTISLVRK